MKNKKILIIGVDSFIGSHLFNFFSKTNFSVNGTTKRKTFLKKFNLFDKSKFNTILNDTDIVIFCSGISKKLKCEKSKFLSKMINFYLPMKLFKIIKKKKIKLIYFSTYDLFDGTKKYVRYDEIPSPVTEYGKQKLMIENFLKRYLSTAIVIRASKIISSDLGLIKNWLRSVKNKKKIYPFTNKYLSPVHINDLFNYTRNLINKNENGLFNVSSNMNYSYYDFIYKIVENNKLDTNLLVPKLSDENVMFNSFKNEKKTFITDANKTLDLITDYKDR